MIARVAVPSASSRSSSPGSRPRASSRVAPQVRIGPRRNERYDAAPPISVPAVTRSVTLRKGVLLPGHHSRAGQAGFVPRNAPAMIGTSSRSRLLLGHGSKLHESPRTWEGSIPAPWRIQCRPRRRYGAPRVHARRRPARASSAARRPPPGLRASGPGRAFSAPSVQIALDRMLDRRVHRLTGSDQEARARLGDSSPRSCCWIQGASVREGSRRARIGVQPIQGWSKSSAMEATAR